MLRAFYPALALGFVAGCGVALTLPAHDPLPYAIGAAALSVLIFILRRYAQATIAIVLAIGVLFGMVRVSYSVHVATSPLVEHYGTSIDVVGTVVGSVEHTHTRSRYAVDLHTVGGESVDRKTRVLVYEPFPTQCVPGEEVYLSGFLREAEDFLTDTGRIFRYRQYLARQEIYGILSSRESSCLGHAAVHQPFTDVREILLESMHHVLPVNEASLLAGLVLGVRSSISPELIEAFRITGLLHIVVLSGYNITIVAEAIRRLLSRVPRALSTAISLISVFLFVLLAGAQVAAVRAGVMGSIGLFARSLYREYNGIRILVVVAGLMALYNPATITTTSFHLSFLATFGLLVFSPLLERRLGWLTDSFQVRSIVAVTVSTQVFLLPYLAFAIGEVSIIGILSNILVLPIIPLAMLLGVVVTAVGIVSTSLGVLLSPIAYLPLAYVTGAVSLFAKVPYATLPLFSISWWFVIAVYALLCVYGMRTVQR